MLLVQYTNEEHHKLDLNFKSGEGRYSDTNASDTTPTSPYIEIDTTVFMETTTINENISTPITKV